MPFTMPTLRLLGPLSSNNLTNRPPFACVARSKTQQHTHWQLLQPGKLRARVGCPLQVEILPCATLPAKLYPRFFVFFPEPPCGWYLKEHPTETNHYIENDSVQGSHCCRAQQKQPATSESSHRKGSPLMDAKVQEPTHFSPIRFRFLLVSSKNASKTATDPFSCSLTFKSPPPFLKLLTGSDLRSLSGRHLRMPSVNRSDGARRGSMAMDPRNVGRSSCRLFAESVISPFGLV